MGLTDQGAATGLRHPADLAAWRRWQASRAPLRSARRRVVGRLRPDGAGAVLTTGTDPRVLVVLDSLGPSSRASLLEPLRHLALDRVAVLAPGPVHDVLPGAAVTRWRPGVPLPGRLVISSGHYLPLGAVGQAHAEAVGAPHLVLQHGLLTPHAPPLPPGAHLAAWSGEDATFWAGGRPDVATHVVGSALLAAAATTSSTAPDGSGGLTYLGQLHGAELPRPDLARAAESFCRATGATYRPHPHETDRRSRRTHAGWAAAGITVDRTGVPLTALGTGVVSVFSTGVLEAAALGLPAWVEHPDPPPWLRDFWTRYGMARWGGDPTPAPARPRVDPALATAALVEELR